MLVKTAGGGQNFGDAVMLGANTTLTDVPPGSSSANITFQKTIDSDAPATPRALTVNTRGATAFSGAVGSTTVLASLTTDAQSGLPGEETVLAAARSTPPRSISRTMLCWRSIRR